MVILLSRIIAYFNNKTTKTNEMVHLKWKNKKKKLVQLNLTSYSFTWCLLVFIPQPVW